MPPTSSSRCVPQRARLKPGASLQVSVAATVPLLPRAPAALGGALRIKVRGGTTLQIPWAIAVPAGEARPDPGRAALEPHVRSVGRRAGGADRRRRAGRRNAPSGRSCCRSSSSRSSSTAARRTSAGSRSCATCFPGRYSFGITGRGPGRQAPAAGGLLAPPHRPPDRRGCDRRADRPVHDLMRARAAWSRTPRGRSTGRPSRAARGIVGTS